MHTSCGPPMLVSVCPLYNPLSPWHLSPLLSPSLQTLEQGRTPQGGLRVKSASGNAAKAGVQVGDTVIYTSSFFGDELWPADKLASAWRRVLRWQELSTYQGQSRCAQQASTLSQQIPSMGCTGEVGGWQTCWCPASVS